MKETEPDGPHQGCQSSSRGGCRARQTGGKITSTGGPATAWQAPRHLAQRAGERMDCDGPLGKGGRGEGTHRPGLGVAVLGAL